MFHDAPGDDLTDAARPAPPAWQRFAPLAVLALVLVAALALRLDRYLSIESLSRFDGFVVQHLAAALALFIALYVLSSSVALPFSIYLNLAAGYLFGPWLGGGAAWIASLTGSTIFFLAVRTAFGDSVRRSAGPWLARFESGFRDGAFNYLLALRLTPILPFWVVNVAAALFEVRLRDYVLATMIGIVPVIFVGTSVGAAVHEAVRLGATLDPVTALRELLFSPPVLAALAGMICLALAPVIIRKLRART